MKVIPAVNEETFAGVRHRVEQAASLLKKLGVEDRWVHIDVTDGKFTPNFFLWNNPEELKKISERKKELGIKIEIHLMINDPEKHMGEWFKAGADRVISHVEVMQQRKKACLCGGVVVLAASPETSAEELLERGECAKQLLILAVKPGKSGQKFDPHVLEKIKFLHEQDPDVIIEVDGGINFETAKLAKALGADIIVSSSYIWHSDHPDRALKKLLDL